MTATSVSTPPSTRRYDLDWLRVLGMLVVFLFHSIHFFDSMSWHVKNNLTAGWLDYVIGALGQWLMPLFFVVSGAAIFLALNPRRTGAFLWSRVLRLDVPWVLGMFVIGPPQVYFERVTHNSYTGSLLHFYANDLLGHGFYSQGNFPGTGMHLWYVAWLLVYTIVLLPLFLALRTRAGQRAARGIANVFAHPRSILALAVLVPIFHILGAATDFLWEEAGWELLTYLVLLFLGFLLMTDARYTEACRRIWPVALALAFISLMATPFIWDFGENVSDGQYVLQWTVRGLGAWWWIVAFLGLARRYLSFSNRFLQYSNEAVLPFYILHQTVILTLGFFIRDWMMPIAAKFPLMLAVDFAIIMALYEFGIRRVNVLRFLFGMRPLRRRTTPTAG